jgi:hypothetical protein
MGGLARTELLGGRQEAGSPNLFTDKGLSRTSAGFVTRFGRCHHRSRPEPFAASVDDVETDFDGDPELGFD